jgi:hypothetical protein
MELHSIGVQPFLWLTRKCEETQAKWPWSFRVGKMFSYLVIISLCLNGIFCLALIIGATSIGLLQGGGEACLHIEPLLAQAQRLQELEG